MKFKAYFFVLLFCGIFMSSCQKEEIIPEPLNKAHLKTEAYSTISNPETKQHLEKKKIAACTKINLFTDWITVSHEEYEDIQNTLINSGISLIAPVCEVYYFQNASTNPAWAQRVMDSFTDVQIGQNDVTFRISDLNIACYYCPLNPTTGANLNSFCSAHGLTVHVALGSNGCLLGNFTLDTINNQNVEIEPDPIIRLNSCQMLDCAGSGF